VRQPAPVPHGSKISKSNLFSFASLRCGIRVLTEAEFTERRRNGKTRASSMFWEEEECCRRHLLQTRSWIDQDQWSSDRVGWTIDPPLQSLRTHPLVGKAPFRRRGGHTAQIYAIRQSIAKALIAYYQKYVDEQSKKEIKDILVRYDRTLLVADRRRCEPKKFGGRGARARFQKSYRWRCLLGEEWRKRCFFCCLFV